MTTIRSVSQLIQGHQQREGGGFVVTRPFPTQGLAHLDPFLLLDELGPVDYAPGQAIGAPDHPHRGFETVTYLLEGEGEHADSTGHAGLLQPGDVQWMTAGAGIVHREMPSRRMLAEGGRSHGFQLWVNLPAAHKLSEPAYQEVPATAIPHVQVTPEATARVIAGAVAGVEGAVRTRSPVAYHHWTLTSGAEIALPTPTTHTVAIYVFEGAVSVGGTTVGRRQLAVTGPGDTLRLKSEHGAQLLFLGGEPLREPIAWAGPFVMNTEDEVRQAFADYQAGRLGRIPASVERVTEPS